VGMRYTPRKKKGSGTVTRNKGPVLKTGVTAGVNRGKKAPRIPVLDVSQGGKEKGT